MSNSVRKIMGSGSSGLAAQSIVGDVQDAQTATGSTQTDAFLISADNTRFTTVASSTGCRLPADAAPGDSVFIYNSGANALSIYPPTSGTINAISANGAYSLAAAKGVFIVKMNSTGWFTVLTA
jgi:hypothetical protein